MDAPAHITIGTCAWSFEDWRGVFYPENLPANRWLEFYSRNFPAIEVDSTFYHAPAPHVTAHWHEVTPDGFRFACKLPREITHERKLRECEEPLREFLDALLPLGGKLACVLIQLPPYFAPEHDEAALRQFVHALPRGVRFAIEFRHHGWHQPRIVHLLEEHRVAWVWCDMTPLDHQQEGAFEFLPDATDFLYVRLMGDLEKKYASVGERAHQYRALTWPRDAALENWAERVRQAAASHAEIFIAANNHFEGFAPLTCRRMARLLDLPLNDPAPGEDAEGESDDGQLELL